MMHWSEAQLLELLSRFLWPILRTGAFIMAMPVFNSHSVPVRVRVIMVVTFCWLVAPTLESVPVLDMLGLSAIFVAMREILIGMVMGFIMQMAFAALIFAGQSIAYSMGLGFASMIDPQLGVQVPIISQVYLLFATLLFLAADGHLVLIEMIAASFHTLPLGMEGLAREDLWTIVRWSTTVFVGGVLLSLPIMVTLLFVNIAFGIATRAAPQLNIFSVGFPVTLMLGLAMMWVTFPAVLHRFSLSLPGAYELIAKLLRV